MTIVARILGVIFRIIVGAIWCVFVVMAVSIPLWGIQQIWDSIGQFVATIILVGIVIAFPFLSYYAGNEVVEWLKKRIR